MHSEQKAAAKASSRRSDDVNPYAYGGECPIDGLPDELLLRVLLTASLRGWNSIPVCSGASLLDPDDGPPEPDLTKLAPLRAVCRRFRRLIDDPAACERLAADHPTDAAVPLLASRRLSCLTIQHARFRPAALRSVLVSDPLRSTLQELDVICDAGVALPVSAFAAISKLEGLRTLALGSEDKSAPAFHAMCAPPTQRSLARLSCLHLEKLHFYGVPLTLKTLRELRPLAGTLRGLHADVLLFQGESMRPLIEAVAAFPLLETLTLHTKGDDGGMWPEGSEEELRALAALTNLRALEMRCLLLWVGFLPAMPRLEHASLFCTLEANDLAPLRNARPLRSLVFEQEVVRRAQAAATAEALRALTNLEAMNLNVSAAVYRQLGRSPLTGWSRLRSVQLARFSAHRRIPLLFVERLMADASALEELQFYSPPPAGAAGLLRGPRFRRLVLLGPAATSAGPAARERLRAELPPPAALHFAAEFDPEAAAAARAEGDPEAAEAAPSDSGAGSASEGEAP